jgi:hypothetical protein
MGIDLRVGLTQKTKLHAYSFNISYFNFHEYSMPTACRWNEIMGLGGSECGEYL